MFAPDAKQIEIEVEATNELKKKKLAKAINLVRLLPFFQVRSLQCLRRDAAIVMV